MADNSHIDPPTSANKSSNASSQSQFSSAFCSLAMSKKSYPVNNNVVRECDRGPEIEDLPEESVVGAPAGPLKAVRTVMRHLFAMLSAVFVAVSNDHCTIADR